jgi:hypothetical protein
MPTTPLLEVARTQPDTQGYSQGKSSQDQGLDGVDLGAQGGVILDALDDLLDGRDDGGVVLATERPRQVGVGVLGVVARDVHRPGSPIFLGLPLFISSASTLT